MSQFDQDKLPDPVRTPQNVDIPQISLDDDDLAKRETKVQSVEKTRSQTTKKACNKKTL